MNLSKLRENKYVKSLLVLMAVNMLTQIAFPSVALALTSGPSTPEVQSFEPVGTTDMVDLFTGDFTYNIPLFELPGPNGGYPFNLAYHSGVDMEQEASWVGLGWNINPGTINRSMRGLPDDFNGDNITKTMDMKDNVTFGAGLGYSGELFGGTSSAAFAGTLGLNLKIYYNNYRGVGYAFSPDFGVSHKPSGIGSGIGLTLDSQEGVGANANLSLTSGNSYESMSLNAGIGFNSKSGFDVSTGLSFSKTVSGKKNGKYVAQHEGDTHSSRNKYQYGTGGSSSYSFSTVTYTPSSSFPTWNNFMDFRYKTGTGNAGVFANISIRGFFSTQYMANPKHPIKHSAYGYNYLEQATSSDLLDFNRSKDGVIRKESPNLAMPNLTYDYYNVTGQGVAGMYRPYRSDIGVLHDPLVVSNTFGGAGGVDIGPGASPHVGVSGSITMGQSYSDLWNNDNHMDEYYAFVDPEGTQSNYPDVTNEVDKEIYEKVYYKARGEMTSFDETEMDFIGGEKPVRFDLTNDPSMKVKQPIDNILVDKTDATVVDANTIDQIRRPGTHNGRMPRNMSVQPITNKQMGGGATSAIGEYKVKYYAGYDNSTYPYTSAPTGSVNRYNNPSHIGGITSINNDGVRYVYGLPAYNTSDKEYTFSVGDALGANTSLNVDVPTNQSGKSIDGVNYSFTESTNEYFSKTEVDPYAYAYLITSILGTDYVDVNNNGPDDADMGYWVKFNYVKTNDAYQWRAPFTGANYNPGLEYNAEDNTAGFKYGTKEVYHLATVETKTHIAVFKISNTREDAIGANAIINNNGTTITDNVNSQSFKLDKISLYTKDEYNNNTANAIPVKEVHFTYDYSLCQGVPNAQTGKLTLTSVYFTYQKNDRGQLTPYTFTYNSSNPNYDNIISGTRYKHIDRWGNYKNIIGGPVNPDSPSDYIENMYVQQFDESVTQTVSDKATFQAHKDLEASAWHLSKITLPTGGTIQVDFEADDYGYVQHKVAQQMFRIQGLGFNHDEQVYESKSNSNRSPNPDRKVYFKLETPILQGGSDLSNFESQYINNLHYEEDPSTGQKTYQVYYKFKSVLRGDLQSGYKEYVAGYSDLEGWGLDPSSVQYIDLGDGNGQANYYTEGYVTLKNTDINGTVLYHPFAVAAWQQMRTQQPNLLTAAGNIGAAGTSSSTRLQKILSLVSIYPELIQLLQGYRQHAFDHDYARTIDLNKSFIRLCSPDKKKYGGGQRVKQITMSDQWGQDVSASNSGENNSSYGLVYEYSGGVAQYEPLLGGDENALHYAKNFAHSIRTFTDNNLFFEYPINESYYPGPVVGYTKVKVKSINTQNVINNNKNNVNDDTPITGLKEYEFYTAKDFPVITDETDNLKLPYNQYIPIPFIGQIRTDNLTASQGYSIVLNDMHGKPRAIRDYRLTKDGSLNGLANSVEYLYKSKAKHYQHEDVLELVNDVETINTDVPDASYQGGAYWKVTPITRKMGVEYEFFTDMRENRSYSVMGGVQLNNDQIGPIPAFFPWPTFNKSTKSLNTAVTNKIIHKAGILDKTVVQNEKSTIVSKNLLRDEQTGRIILSSVTTDYDDPMYKYDIPAHWKYDEGVGPAYKNYGLSFTADIASDITANVYHISDPNGNIPELAHLVPGDQFTVSGSIATYLGESKCNAGNYLFYSTDQNIPGYSKSFFLYRSGRRNHLHSNVSTIVGLNDPTTALIQDNSCSGSVSNPACVYVSEYRYVQSELDKLLGMLRLLSKLINPSITPNILQHNSYQTGIDLSQSPYYNDYVASGLSATNKNICYVASNTSYTNYLIFQEPSSVGCNSIKFQNSTTGWIEIENLTSVPTTQQELTLDASTGDVFITVQENGVNRVVNLGAYPMCTSVILAVSALYQGTEIQSVSTSTQLNKYKVNNVINLSAVELSDDQTGNTNYTVDGLLTNNTQMVPDAYSTGKRGVWHANKSYAYFSDRKGDFNNVDLNTDGTMDNVPLFNYSNPDLFTTCEPSWKLTNEITKYDDRGYEVEAKNILGIYSSAKYDANKDLPILVASNARYDEAYYECFENGVYTAESTEESHTGNKSLKITTGSLSIITGMTPTAGKEFILSSWIKWPASTKGYTNNVTTSDPGVTEINKIRVDIKDAGGSVLGSTDIVPVGEVIEGWQKIEGTFTVPAGSPASIELSIVPATINSTVQTIYLDDIRIFPSDGNIVTYVYDPVTYRLAAVLDENNYASLFYYDESGKLFLKKIETAEGIKTILESRNHTKE